MLPHRAASVSGVLASLILALSALAGAAEARQSPKKAIWGPALLNGVSQLPLYRDLGAGIYQAQLR